MERQFDPQFFSKLAVFLEDSPPESVLQQPVILQGLQDALMSTDIRLNNNALSILRLWCRKIMIHRKFEDDIRMKNTTQCKEDVAVHNVYERFVVSYAELASSLFRKTDIFPNACITTKELLTAGQASPTEHIIERVLNKLNDGICRTTLLEILSNSNTVIEKLPIYDADIANYYPILHRQLINISPQEDKERAEKIINIVRKIDSINAGHSTVDRNLMQYCNYDEIENKVTPEELSLHPSSNIRIRFYQRALANNQDVNDFLDPLITRGIFDPKVNDICKKIIENNYNNILEIGLTPRQIAHLQSAIVDEQSNFFKFIISTINSQDDYNTLCSWIRYLFAINPSIKKIAIAKIEEIVGQKLNFDLSQMNNVDIIMNEYIACLKLDGKPMDRPEIPSFIEIIKSDSHTEVAKRMAATTLTKFMTNPFNQTQKYFNQIRNLSFSQFPELMHILSIRDGTFQIDSVDRLKELICSINNDNMRHLIPVLGRVAFEYLLKIESNGSSLLRIPRFAAATFNIPTMFGFYDPQYYEPTEIIPDASIIQSWISFKKQPEEVLNELTDYPKLNAIVMTNPRLSGDFLAQLDNDEGALPILKNICPPTNVLFLLLNATLSSHFASRTAAMVSDELLNANFDLALKLKQAIIEVGGETSLPANITDLIVNEATRRTALGCLMTFVRFHKPIDAVNPLALEKLYEENLPINVKRQLTGFFATLGRSRIGTMLVKDKDPVTKSLAFHISEFTKESEEEAISTALVDSWPICMRSSAIDFLIEYYRENLLTDRSLSQLYYNVSGENPLTFSLLKLLYHPQIRSQVPTYLEFIYPYLQPNANQLFTTLALNSLHDYLFDAQEIVRSLTDLIVNPKFTNLVMHLIITFPKGTLKTFSQEFLKRVVDTIDRSFNEEIDLEVAFACINRLMLINTIQFPDDSMHIIMKLYQYYVENNYCSYEVHVLLKQIFKQSMEARKQALKCRFVDIALKELFVAKGSERALILTTCSQFMYMYPRAQRKFLDVWGISTLIKLFYLEPVTIHFFLCFAKQCNECQSAFLSAVSAHRVKNSALKRDKTLFDMLVDSVEDVSNKALHPLLLELLANILHSDTVRSQIFFDQKKIPHYVSTIEKYASLKDTVHLEAWLRVFVTLTLYGDGLKKLFKVVRVPELLLFFFRGSDEVRKNKLFIVFLRNLIRSNLWTAVHDKVIYLCEENREKHLIPIFESIEKMAQEM